MYSFRKKEKRSGNDVDMTSMVDVTFLLLIFFMVTASFQLQKSIAMPPQHLDLAGKPIEPIEMETVRVQVDDRESFLVMTPQWEREIAGKQRLLTSLKQAVGESSEPVNLSVEIHEQASLRSLVDVLDAGVSAGFAAHAI